MEFQCTRWRTSILAAVTLAVFCAARGEAQTPEQQYEYAETRALVSLVDDAAVAIHTRGDTAFSDFRVPGSRWRQGDAYIFVLDPDGNMLVHPDPAMESRNEIGLKDINGRPIVRGLIDAATAVADKPAGWYHYQWPVPGGLLPRWKSSYVRLAVAPSGRRYIVGSGMYNDRMERAFVVDAVREAVGQIRQRGEAAYALFRDATSPFAVKDSYIFVIDPQGTDLVNPAFPSLEGRNLLDVKDTHGKALVREMLSVVQTRGSGWVDYMWPKPGESVSTQKSTYVTKATIGTKWVVVGSGVYLANAPKAAKTWKMTAPQLMTLVREGAAEFTGRGENAFPEFRRKGSKWFRDDMYFFVWTLNGTRVFHAADQTIEGRDVKDLRDVLGRPFGRMFLEAAASPSGEGWIHYMYPEPGDIFPTWKSTFVKRVTFPSGKQYVVGSGIYNMQTDKPFIEDIVDRAATLVAARGTRAFPELRDKSGPFVFMDTYVFVDSPEGVELVNAAQPSLEGTKMMGLKDVHGKPVADEYIAIAMKGGSGWVDYYWYRPGTNVAAPKHTYVRRVQFGAETYIVGSGFYAEEKNDLDSTSADPAHHQVVFENDQVRVVRWAIGVGDSTLNHSHPNNVSIALTDYNGRVRTPDGTSDVHLKAGSATWREADVHAVHNLSKRLMTGIIIEPKQPASVRPPGSADPVTVDPQHQKVQFENEQIRVIHERQSGSFPMHGHPDNVQVLLSDMNVRVITGDGKTQIVTGKAGEVRWRPATQHAGKNLADKPFEQIVIEMKNGKHFD